MMRDKMILAMDAVLLDYMTVKEFPSSGFLDDMLDAALDVMMDPANWTNELTYPPGSMNVHWTRQQRFAATILAIKAIKEGK